RATEDAVGTAAEQVPTESAEPLPRQPEIIAASTEPQEVMAATGDDADAEPAEAPAADEIVAAIESAEPEPAVVDIESALRDAAHVQSTDVVEGDAAPDVAVPAAGDSGEALAMTGTEPAANNGEVDVPDATEASEITWSTGPAEAPAAAETAATRASDAS